MKNKKINYAITLDTFSIGSVHFSAISYDLSDELFEYLRSIGKTVLRLHYGYYNGYDVIEWRD